MIIGLTDKIPRLDTSVHTPKNMDMLPLSRWTWADAIYQSRWGICIYPDDRECINIMRVAEKLSLIESFIAKPIHVLSWLRCRPYNQLIGGAMNSHHIHGLACDFAVDGMHADNVRLLLKDKLSEFIIRLQKHPHGTTWCHMDLADPGKTGRFFT